MPAYVHATQEDPAPRFTARLTVLEAKLWQPLGVIKLKASCSS